MMMMMMGDDGIAVGNGVGATHEVVSGTKEEVTSSPGTHWFPNLHSRLSKVEFILENSGMFIAFFFSENLEKKTFSFQTNFVYVTNGLCSVGQEVKVMCSGERKFWVRVCEQILLFFSSLFISFHFISKHSRL